MLSLITVLLFCHSAVSLHTATVKIHLHPVSNTTEIHPDNTPLNISYGNRNQTIYSEGNGRHTATLMIPISESNSTTLITIENPVYTQKANHFYMRNVGVTWMKVNTDEYRMTVKTYAKEQEVTELKSLQSCHCMTNNCACCMHVNIPHFDHTLCTNLTYNPQTIGLDLSIGIDGFYYTKEISVRNPPPVCFDVPGYKEIASICVALTELDLTRKFISGCIELEAEIIHLRALKLHLGCFKMPI